MLLPSVSGCFELCMNNRILVIAPLLAAWLTACSPRDGSSLEADSGPPDSEDAGGGMDADADGPEERDASHDDSGGPDPKGDGGPIQPSDAGGHDAAPSNGPDADTLDATVPDDAPASDATVTDPTDPAPDAGPELRPDGCAVDAPLALNRVRIYPAAGEAALLVGARIQGSNTGPTSDFVDLATVTQAPAENAFSELTFVNERLFRYLRFYAPAESSGGLASIEFLHGETVLHGAGFGTASAVGHPYTAALDSDLTSYFAGAAIGGNYVGLDIAGSFVAAAPRFSPDGQTSVNPLSVSLGSTTAGAHIRYTLDGSNPSRELGTEYTSQLLLERGRINLRAIAYASCYFDSAVSSASYTMGSQPIPVTVGLKTYHLGNSLTDTINPWLEPIADSTGVDHVYARWTIPGAPIRWLNEHKREGFETPEGAGDYDTFVRTFAPIDHLSLQPFSDPDFVSQGGAAVELLTAALTHSPELQVWIYAQWPGRTDWQRDAFSNGGGPSYPEWRVPSAPTTWEDATRNHLLYHEAFRTYVDERVPGKALRIVPGGLALVELKRQMDAGAIPGLSDFFNTMFDDDLHLSRRAQYLVSLVFYACLYRQTPEARVTHAGTDLTVEQALAFQRIAWSTASTYSLSGITP
jgi:Fn3 associated